MEGKHKKHKSKSFEDSAPETTGFNFSKSIKLQAGEYVWCTCTGSPSVLGKLVTIENAPDHIKKSSRSNTILIQFIHDGS